MHVSCSMHDLLKILVDQYAIRFAKITCGNKFQLEKSYLIFFKLSDNIMKDIKLLDVIVLS